MILPGQRDGGDVVEAEQLGAQPVVDVVGVVGDVVGEGGDLRLARSGSSTIAGPAGATYSQDRLAARRARDSGRAACRRGR